MKKAISCFLAIALTLICTFSFTACNSNNTDEITDWGEWTVISSPSCTDDGEEVRVRQNDFTAFEIRTYAIAYGHDWDEWEETVAPTCLVDGYKTRICKTCGNSDLQPIPAFGHKWGEWEVTVSPTCETDGYETRVCDHDSKHTETRSTDAFGHEFSEWVTITAPTCLTTGVEKRVCIHDNKHSEVRSVPALGHDFNDWVLTTAPTCETGGVETKFCKHDNEHTQKRYVPHLGHEWGEWVMTTAPTETDDGIETRVCKHDSTHVDTRTAYGTALGTPYALWFELNENGTGYIIGLADLDYCDKVVIPSHYENKPITVVTKYGFAFSLGLTSVSFANGTMIKDIEEGTFMGCTNLTNVQLFEGIETIGVQAFGLCPNIESITIPASVTSVGMFAFLDWTESQTIYVKGFSSETEADEAWGAAWRDTCNATIIYQG